MPMVPPGRWSGPSPPSGYDVAKAVKIGRTDCMVTVGFDRQANQIPRFLVKLHYVTSSLPPTWTAIARFDHNEIDPQGHDIYSEGLHIDVDRADAPERTIEPQHGPIPHDRGKVIRWCVDYFEQEAQWFIDVYEGTTSGTSPNPWPP